MSLLTFKGGVHPKDGKALTNHCPVVAVQPKGEMVYPLSQHIGAPAVPVVQQGDRVLRGEKIGEADGFVSVPIHSAVSGTVKALEKRLDPTGKLVDCIVIENDGAYEEVTYQSHNVAEMSNEEILQAIQEAGVVGMGGAGFPTHGKLTLKEPEKIKWVVVNGAECEPYVTANHRRMAESAKELVEGLKLILRLVPNARGLFAIEDNKPDCVKILREAVRGEERLQVQALKAKYPQGGKRQLVYALSGQDTDSSMRLSDVGYLVINVESVAAVYYGVYEGKPLIDRIVTVSGDAIANPGNFKVPIGTSHGELVEAAGGFSREPMKVVSGGLMMGFAISTLDVPIIKTSAAVVAMEKDPVALTKESACINCGRCVAACPSRIIPSRLADYANRDDVESFVNQKGLECIECGCCSYVCPAKRQLKQAMSYMRGVARANRRKKA